MCCYEHGNIEGFEKISISKNDMNGEACVSRHFFFCFAPQITQINTDFFIKTIRRVNNKNYWCPIKLLVTNKIRADSICRIQPFMVI